MAKESCRPSLRCASGDALSKAQCCEDLAPVREKKVVRTERASPIEGFSLPGIHAFEVGDLPTSCVIDRKKRELTVRTKVLPAKAGVYGGCCFEHPEPLAMNAEATAAAALHISHSEELVQITVEQSSGTRQGYIHNGKLAIGSHQLTSGRLDLPEVRRLCVAVFGSKGGEPHETSLTIKRVTFHRPESYAQR